MSSSIACANFPLLAYPSPLLEEEVLGSLSSKNVDYALPCSWQEKALAITLLVLKILILPWGLVEGARYLLGRIAMMIIYPAQSALVKKYFLYRFRAEQTDKIRWAGFQKLAQDDYAVRHVVLEKAGVRYSGLLVGHRTTLNNGDWVLQSVGNADYAEAVIATCASMYKNVLIVNGPSVGRSQGVALPQTMGDAQDVALSFLEDVIKAKRIAFMGLSLGAAAQSQAIMQHKFKSSCEYLVMRQMTFDTVSNVTYEFVKKVTHSAFLGYAAAGLVRFCGLQIDSVAASKKLRALNIKEVVMQAGYVDHRRGLVFQDDEVIPAAASLGAALMRENINTEIIPLPNASHNDDVIEVATAMRARQFMAHF